MLKPRAALDLERSSSMNGTLNLVPRPCTISHMWKSASEMPVTASARLGGPSSRERNSLPRQTVERARSRVAASAPSKVIPGKVIAELTFGFWTYLVSDLHEKRIWVPYLHRAFPDGTNRKKLNATLTSLRDFRNRVAHHEKILANPEAKRRQLVSIAKLISPELHTHISAHSQIVEVQNTRP